MALLQTIVSETIQNPSMHIDVQSKPTEFLRNEADDPYYYKATLSWCIVGPMGQRNSGKEIMTCDRMAVKEIHSNNLANHHFQIKMELENVGREEMFRKMFHQDFCEDKLVIPDQSIKQNWDASIFREDKKFQNLMKKTRMVSAHYELPLPLPSKMMTLHCQRTDI